ncbi:hypothetical protein [Paenibacillus lautus]|uniref:hypothetical protein n=1 Tax=Paenibacillus lautus TaxID=1401 RepID=UPI003D2BE5F6
MYDFGVEVWYRDETVSQITLREGNVYSSARGLKVGDLKNIVSEQYGDKYLVKLSDEIIDYVYDTVNKTYFGDAIYESIEPEDAQNYYSITVAFDDSDYVKQIHIGDMLVSMR